MSLSVTLANLKNDAIQCSNLITNAHKTDPAGKAILPVLDQEQITVAAFLNLFISWEKFLESAMTKLMAGSTTIKGSTPVRYVTPLTEDAANIMIIGVNKYFAYSNIDNLRKMAKIYFHSGYPFEPHLSAITLDLADLRTMRNASAHASSTTQTALEGLAQRIFSTPRPGIGLYEMLIAHHPRSATRNTVFAHYQEILTTTAELIANG